MKKIKYKYNWCEYFDKCDHFPDIEIGSYECSKCQYHIMNKLGEKSKCKPCDYKRYFEVYEGHIICNHN